MIHRQINKSTGIALIALLLSLVLVVGCGGSSTPEAPADTTTKAEPTATTPPTATVVPTIAPAPRGEVMEFPLVPDWVSQARRESMVLQIVQRIKPGEVDLHRCSSTLSCQRIFSPRFNQLIQYDPINITEITGDLASSWEVSVDGLNYTFTIHDARWHDGQPVTADDIVFSLDRIVQPGEKRTRTAALREFYEYQTAEAVDEKTVNMPLISAGAVFLPALASESMKMYPKHVVENLSADDVNCCPEKLLGSGPWKLKGYDRAISVEYERNDDYFKTGLPFFDGWRYNIIPTVPGIYAAFEAGQVHTTLGYSSLFRRRDVLKVLEDSKGTLQADFIPTYGGTGFVLTQQPPFDDPRVRRAFYLGINRQHLLDVVYYTEEYGYGANLGDFFTMRGLGKEDIELVGQPGYRENKAEDIAAAKALLTEAGLADGFEVELNMGQGSLATSTSEVISEQLRRDLGINLVLRPVDTAAYHANQIEGRHPISFAGGSIQMIIDPSDNLQYAFDLDTAGNPDNWSDPELTRLIEAQADAADTEERAAILREIMAILREGETHWVPTIWRDMGMVYDHRLMNWIRPLSGELTLKWENVWWDPNAPVIEPPKARN